MDITRFSYMRLFSIIFILGMLVAACSADNEVGRYARLVEEWQGREIVIPEGMTDVLTGDTIEFSESDFIILTYIDSSGCTGCSMKLPLWQEFMESLDTISADKDVTSVIVVNTADNKDLSCLIRRDNYHYPIVNDTADSFNALNGFPEDSGFRTLLIDSRHRVIAVGNPATNNAVADLYRSIISGGKVFSNNGRQMVSVDVSKIDIGQIAVNEDRKVSFILHNNSDDTVRIREITPSCHCITVNVTDSELAPKQKKSVNVSIQGDSINGLFHRFINIYYHGFDNPTVLEITGSVFETCNCDGVAEGACCD